MGLALLHTDFGRPGVSGTIEGHARDTTYPHWSVSQLLILYISADVIKVEHPVRGDDTRAWGPPYAEYEDASKKGPGESAYYLSVWQIYLCSHCLVF